MWASLSHTLGPLTSLIYTKVQVKWIVAENNSFEDIMWILDCNILLTFSDDNFKKWDTN